MTTKENLPVDAGTMGEPFAFSFGRDKYDNYPEQCIAGSWSEFVEFFNTHRAPVKGVLQITSTMGGDGRRCKANAQPRNWIAFDLDGGIENGTPVPLSDDRFNQIRNAFARIGLGLVYETASSTPAARRARFVLALDTHVTRDDAKRVCEVVERMLPRGGNWDRSVYRAEQPLFMPPKGVSVDTFGDDTVCAAEILAMAPRQKVKVQRVLTSLETQLHALTLERLKALGLVIEERGHGKHEICCPWSHLHTDGRAGAAYFDPSPENGGVGGFKCLHAHCENRNIADLLRFIEACEGVRHAA